MKKVLFLSLITLISFASCKKDKDGGSSGVSEGTITFKVDGKDITYKTYVNAVKNEGADNYLVAIVGIKSPTDPEGENIFINLNSNSAITAGTYHEKALNENAAVIYYKNDKDEQYLTIESPANPTIVTVTSISDNSIQGTFKGELFFMSGASVDFDKTIAISEGKFNAKIISGL